MPLRGRPTREDGKRRNRVPLIHEWIDVPDAPFTGTPPVSLPDARSVLTRSGEIMVLKLHPRTRTWWRAVSRMPHCRQWDVTDWQFAADTAMVADALYYGDTKAAAELRQRERILGTTLDARRQLRIRYVDPDSLDAPQAPDGEQLPKAAGAEGATVTSMADRRRRLLADDAP